MKLSDDKSYPTPHVKRSGHGDAFWEKEKCLLSCWKKLPLITLTKIFL